MIRLLSICLLFVFQVSRAQTPAEGCDGLRYIYNRFSEDEVKMTTVQFGQNTDILGLPVNLMMDVYEPKMDEVTKRPLIIFAYGGAFISGSRQDVADACRDFARKGFVAAGIDYRLYSIFAGLPDSIDVLDAIVKATHDMKASVRFFRQDAATVDQFHIDPDRIYVGGVSAGAITALHAAYLDDDDTLPTHFADILTENGGLEGESGNPDYSSIAQGIINLSGALYKHEWLDAGEGFLVSMHGTDDPIVPYLHGIATADINGLPIPFVSLEGSGLINARATQLGVPNYLLSVAGGMHEDIYLDPSYEAFRIQYTLEGSLFIYEQVCPGVAILPNAILEVDKVPAVNIFPNPAASGQELTLQWPGAHPVRQVEVLGGMGRSLYSQPASGHQLLLNLSEPGVYWVRVYWQDDNLRPEVRKVVVVVQ